MELKGLKVNIEKTKVMRSSKSGGEIVKTGRLTPIIVGKMASKCLLLLFNVCIVSVVHDVLPDNCNVLKLLL